MWVCFGSQFEVLRGATTLGNVSQECQVTAVRTRVPVHSERPQTAVQRVGPRPLDEGVGGTQSSAGLGSSGSGSGGGVLSSAAEK